MRGRIYPRLAATGIVKNRRTYFPYLLTCIGMVMMYYIMHALVVNEQVSMMKGGLQLQEMLRFGCDVFAMFAVIFLFYTNSFLIRSRKREFGLYNVLGMGKGNLARILIWENLYMALISLSAGLLCGILFSKFAELCIAHVMNSEASLAFSMHMEPVVKVLTLFAVIFILILVHALFSVGRTKPVDLLHGGSYGEKPPKANWLIAFLGLAILIAAYVIAVRIENPTEAFEAFFIAVAMVILATYLLFIAGSVVFCRLLQKNKGYYYKANHFVSVASMTYRMKRNGAGLASICVLSTIVLVMLSAATCLYAGKENQVEQRYAHQIVVQAYTLDGNVSGQLEQAVQEAVQQSGAQVTEQVTWRTLCTGGLIEEDQVILNEDRMVNTLGAFDYSQISEIYLVSLEDYNRMTGSKETLEDNEVLECSSLREYEYDTVTLEGMDTWSIKKHLDGFRPNGDAMVSIINYTYFVVKDFDAVLARAEESGMFERGSRLTFLSIDTDADAETQIQIARTIEGRVGELRAADENFPSVRTDCKERERSDFYGLYSGLFVLGILLGIVFVAATVLIMYYKQVTEGYEDQSKFDIMQRVGMTQKEIRRSIHSQMLTVFLAPLLLAGVHTGFAFPIVRKLLLLFGLLDAQVLITTTVVCFVIFAVFYTVVYLLTSRAYYKIVSGK